MRKVGILGGTFDPIHNGHLVLAKNAYDQLQLDEVLLLVSPDPPHKQDRVKTEFCHRFRMTELASEEYEALTPSDFETFLPAPSYSVHTLKALKSVYPDYDFYFIIGEDSLDAIECWYHPEQLFKLTKLAVAVRYEDDDARTIEEQSEYLHRKYGADIHILNADYVDISSTDIRRKVAEGKSITGLVPKKVEDYIWTEKLYTKLEKI